MGISSIRYNVSCDGLSALLAKFERLASFAALH